MYLERKVIWHAFHPEIRENPTMAEETHNTNALVLKITESHTSHTSFQGSWSLYTTWASRTASFTGNSIRKLKITDSPVVEANQCKLFLWPETDMSSKSIEDVHIPNSHLTVAANEWLFKKWTLSEKGILSQDKTIYNQHLRLVWLPVSADKEIAQLLSTSRTDVDYRV